jgi:hypothetical protein
MFVLGRGLPAGAVNVRIEKRPDVSVIPAGKNSIEVDLTAYAGAGDFTFRWGLRGPGTLIGDTQLETVRYVPPEFTTEAKTLTVVFLQVYAFGDLIKDDISVSFDILAPETDPEVNQLLIQGDSLFRRGFLFEPKEKNAFVSYTEVLKRDPENRFARERLFELDVLCFRKFMYNKKDKSDPPDTHPDYKRFKTVDETLIATLKSQYKQRFDEYATLLEKSRTARSVGKAMGEMSARIRKMKDLEQQYTQAIRRVEEQSEKNGNTPDRMAQRLTAFRAEVSEIRKMIQKTEQTYRQKREALKNEGTRRERMVVVLGDFLSILETFVRLNEDFIRSRSFAKEMEEILKTAETERQRLLRDLTNLCR